MRIHGLAMVVALSGCGISWVRPGRAQGITVKEEAKRLLAVGAVQIGLGGMGIAIAAEAFAHRGRATTCEWVEGTAGQGLSGDGLYTCDTDPIVGAVIWAGVGTPVVINGVINLAAGFYELATGRFIGGR